MSDIDKDWCLKMAALEGDAEIGAGSMSDDLIEWLDCPCSSEVCLPRTAKARIEAQAAEIAQLKERVKELEYEVQCAYEDMAGEDI